jgi:hypothetical protein
MGKASVKHTTFTLGPVDDTKYKTNDSCGQITTPIFRPLSGTQPAQCGCIVISIWISIMSRFTAIANGSMLLNLTILNLKATAFDRRRNFNDEFGAIGLEQPMYIHEQRKWTDRRSLIRLICLFNNIDSWTSP